MYFVNIHSQQILAKWKVSLPYLTSTVDFENQNIENKSCQKTTELAVQVLEAKQSYICQFNVGILPEWRFM